MTETTTTTTKIAENEYVFENLLKPGPNKSKRPSMARDALLSWIIGDLAVLAIALYFALLYANQ